MTVHFSFPIQAVELLTIIIVMPRGAVKEYSILLVSAVLVVVAVIVF